MVFITIGILLISAAGFVSGAAIENALLGDATGRLSWGPALFRALLALHGAVLAACGLHRILRRAALQPPNELAARKTTSARIHLALAGLLGVALVLRLWGLNSCLWFDEVLTLVTIVRLPPGEIISTFPSQNQHMFYSALAFLSVSALGESAAALRLPSVVFGIASIVALFLLGRRVVGPQQALLACALVTVSYHHVWFSQNARGYMGLLFFTLLATWLWMEASSRRRVSWWVAYAVAIALGAWTHMTMVFVAAAHALTCAACELPGLLGRRTDRAKSEWRGGLLPAVAALALAGTLTLQLYALSLPEFLQGALNEQSLPSAWTNPLWVVQESVRGLLNVGPIGLTGVTIGAIVTLAGCVSLFRADRRTAGLMVLPGLLAGATMASLGHNFWPRLFFFCMGFAVLFVIRGVAILPALLRIGPLRSRLSAAAARRTGLILAGLMVPASASILPRCYALPKQDFIGAREFVERTRTKDEPVAAAGLAGMAYEMYFASHWANVQEPAQLERVRAASQRTWMVYTLPIHLRNYHRAIWDVIERDFEVVRVFPGTLGDGAVTVCRERTVDPTQSEAAAVRPADHSQETARPRP
ncbi:MAG: glycosyltransferase family 39 protein [Planctomycetes bacterium]|nr:glycosyltransferase family 39 protein [Planctomycetota bacterium]